MFPAKIYIVGFRGSGKSVLGKALAEYLRYNFVDLDLFFHDYWKQTPSESIRNDGWQGFRYKERLCFLQTRGSRNTVISTGGGIVERADNCLDLMQEYTVFLDIHPNILIYRLNQHRGDRPSLTQLDWESEIRTMLNRRQPWYEQVATLKISVNDPRELPERTLEKIVSQLNKLIVNG